MAHTTIRNFFAGQWQHSSASGRIPVYNRATGEELGQAPCSTDAEVNEAVTAAHAASANGALLRRDEGKSYRPAARATTASQ